MDAALSGGPPRWPAGRALSRQFANCADAETAGAHLDVDASAADGWVDALEYPQAREGAQAEKSYVRAAREATRRVAAASD
jgi:hypothetical protein